MSVKRGKKRSILSRLLWPCHQCLLYSTVSMRYSKALHFFFSKKLISALRNLPKVPQWRLLFSVAIKPPRLRIWQRILFRDRKTRHTISQSVLWDAGKWNDSKHRIGNKLFRNQVAALTQCKEDNKSIQQFYQHPGSPDLGEKPQWWPEIISAAISNITYSWSYVYLPFTSEVVTN